MKINILKKEPKELHVEFDTNDITIADLIADTLIESKDVEFAGVTKEHPEIGKPVLVLKTGSKKAEDVLKKTVEELQESFESLRESLEKSSK